MFGQRINLEQHDQLAEAGVEAVAAKRLGLDGAKAVNVCNEIRPDGKSALRLDFLQPDQRTETTLWVDDRERQDFSEEQVALMGMIACAYPSVDRRIMPTPLPEQLFRY